jgi:pimeloyl-ACP methyl ester carboxylesterase
VVVRGGRPPSSWWCSAGRSIRRNDAPANPEPYALQVHVDDLAGLVQALRVGPAHLVGSSYGAYVALSLALQHPDIAILLAAVGLGGIMTTW